MPASDPTTAFTRRFPAGSAARSRGLLLAGLLLVALNLRGPLSSVPPVITLVSDALSLTPAQAGLLTSIPVFCFAVITPPASMLIARLGPERSLYVALTGVFVGQVVRAASPSLWVALVGTTLLGAGITIGNVAVPVIITRDFQNRSAAVTGVYTATMNLGSAITTILTVPLAVTFSWRWALAGWAMLAIAAYVGWSAAIRRPPANTPLPVANKKSDDVRATALTSDSAVDIEQPNSASAPDVLLTPIASSSSATPNHPPAVMDRSMTRLTVLLTIALVGQAGSFFAMMAWLPEILHHLIDADLAAGANLSAPFQLFAIFGAFGCPLLLHRGLPLRLVSMLFIALWLALPVGLLLAPGAALVWIALAGAAQGGNFTIIFMLVAGRAPSVAAARRSSAVVQTVGYLFAAVSPSLLGALFTATGGWTVPLWFIIGLLTVMAAALAIATKPVQTKQQRPA